MRNHFTRAAFAVRNRFIRCIFGVALVIAVGCAAEAAVRNSNAFTLQIAAYPTWQEAHDAVRIFRFKGIQVEIISTSSTQHGQLYRLRVGRFLTMNAARQQAEKWLQAGVINAYWVVNLEAEAPAYVQLSASAVTEQTGAVDESFIRYDLPQRPTPEIGLGQLLTAVDGKWGVPVPLRSPFRYSLLHQMSRWGTEGNEGRKNHSSAALNRQNKKPLSYAFHSLSGISLSTDEHRLEPKNKARLVSSLRFISGYQDLDFDAEGRLIIGTRIQGGAALARALLLAAHNSHEHFAIESCHADAQVVFGALLTAEFATPTDKRVRFNRIQLDFSDFERLQGEPSVMAAFDPGFVFLHELTHGMRGIADDDTQGGLGACEAFINQMRRQLALPERVTYHFQVKRDASGREKGELLFTSPRPAPSPTANYLYLRWDHDAANGQR